MDNNKEFIGKMKMLGVSDSEASIISSIDFSLYESKFMMTTEDYTKALRYEHGHNRYINLRWYADQIKQYYEDKRKNLLIKKNRYVASIYQAIGTIRLNGIQVEEVIGNYIWAAIVKYINGLYIDSDKFIWNMIPDNIISLYIDLLPLCMHYAIKCDNGKYDIEDNLIGRQNTQITAYGLSYFLTDKLYDLVISYVDDKYTIDIDLVGRHEKSFRYIRNVVLYNKVSGKKEACLYNTCIYNINIENNNISISLHDGFMVEHIMNISIGNGKADGKYV